MYLNLKAQTQLSGYNHNRLLLMWICCSLSILINHLDAQSPGDKFYLVQDETGTQIGNVKDLITDRDDVLWLGTSNGLYTYNGYSFKKKKLFSASTISQTPNINSLYYHEDHHEIWIAGENSIKVFDIENESIRELSIGSEKGSVSRYNFNSIYRDKEHTMWITSFNGLYTCHDTSSICTFHQVQSDLEVILNDPYLNRLNCILPHDHVDSLWIGSLKGIYSFHKKTYEFKPYLSQLNPETNSKIVTSLFDLGDQIAIGTYSQEGLVLVDKLTKKTTQHHIPEAFIYNIKSQPSIYDIAYKDHQSLWVASQFGLFSFNLESHHFTAYPNSSKSPFPGTPTVCNTIIKDTFDHWWVGFENGLSQWDPTRYLMQSYHIQRVFNDHETKFILDVDETPDGRIMVSGHQKGVYVFDGNTFEKAKFHDHLPIADGKTFYNFIVASEDLWLLSDDRELFAYNPNTNQSRKVLDGPAFRKSDFHLFLSHYYDAPNNILWYGRQWGRGIGKLNLNNGDSRLYPQSAFIPDSLISATGFNNISVDNQGDVWFTTGVGICRFSPDSETSIRVSAPGGSKANVESTAFFGLAKNQEDDYWVTVAGEGLFKYDKQNDTLIPSTFQLPSEYHNMGELLFDHQGFLWIITNGGFVRLNTETGSYTIFDQQNGLPKNELHGCSLKEINNQYLSICGVDWVGWLDLKKISEIEKFERQPSLEFHVSGVQIDHHYSPSDKQMNLQAGENSFDVAFPVINYKAKNLNRYQYKLANYDKTWIDNGNQYEAHYRKVRPGKYTFQARSAYGNESWGPVAEMHININAPWWQKWWFYAIITALLAYGIVNFQRYRANQIRREESIKATYEVKLAELEMEALRSQMNPHFIFNALNSIKHFILSNDKFLAAEYLSNFSRLVRQILNNSKSSIITLEEELNTLQLYLDMEKLRFSSKFEYQITVQEGLDLEEIKIPPLILQPYVENAIWHGLMHKEEKGHLIIDVQRENGSIICSIQDDGIGRQKAMAINTKSTLKKKSFGMQITKARIDMSSINAKSEIVDLVDQRGNALGTRVLIYIPNSKNKNE